MFTNFAANIADKKQVWSRKLWQAARDEMFISRFMGNDENSMIQRITELTKTERGEEAIIQLVADLTDDGRVNDDEREGYEEAMQNYEQVIKLGLITHSVRSKGKLSDQKSIIDFRSTGFDRLKYWIANRCDQLGILTLSGISYAYTLDGRSRASSAFQSLAFAADVSAPSTNRARMWDGSALVASSTGSITSAYVPSYKMIVDLIAYAKSHYVRPMMSGGKEYYCLIVHPMTLAALKKDPDYLRAVTAVATKSGEASPWFTGGTVTIDGAVLHETRLTYNTIGAASGSKWGSGGTVNGTRSLLCGAQALAMMDLGAPDWTEKRFQYDSQGGINVDKMLGFLKPKFYSIYDQATEDFGVVTVDTFIG